MRARSASTVRERVSDLAGEVDVLGGRTGDRCFAAAEPADRRRDHNRCRNASTAQPRLSCFAPLPFSGRNSAPALPCPVETVRIRSTVPLATPLRSRSSAEALELRAKRLLIYRARFDGDDGGFAGTREGAAHLGERLERGLALRRQREVARLGHPQRQCRVDARDQCCGGRAGPRRAGSWSYVAVDERRPEPAAALGVGVRHKRTRPRSTHGPSTRRVAGRAVIGAEHGAADDGDGGGGDAASVQTPTMYMPAIAIATVAPETDDRSARGAQRRDFFECSCSIAAPRPRSARERTTKNRP